ncbi:MAG: MFS transporter [Thermodesulfobacteriota bacterium]|nr:MFS transporter [Thermodesulfobacteriota bacterium]
MLYSPIFIAMSFVNLLTVSSFGMFFLFPFFISNHGGTKSDIGIIMGIFALSAVIFRPWISDMIDRIGRKRSYTVGSIIMSSFPLFYLFFQGNLSNFYLPLILIRIFHGIGLAVCFTAAFTYIADIIPKERLNEGIGIFGLSGITGLAVGPAIGELIIHKYGFPAFFFASAAIATLGLLIQIFLPESYTQTARTAQQSFFSILKKKKITVIAILSLIFGFSLSASGSFIAPFAKEMNIAFVSLYYICYSTAAILTRLIGGKIADRVGEKKIIPHALILTGVGLIILALLNGNLILAISGIMSGCGHGFLFPCLNSLAIRGEPINIRGKINGVFTGGLDGGTLAGSIALGYIGDWAGFRILFLIAGLVVFLGLLVLKNTKGVGNATCHDTRFV